MDTAGPIGCCGHANRSNIELVRAARDTILPPNITSTTFAADLDQFRLIVGKEWVFTRDDDLDLDRDSYSPLLGED